MNVLDVVNFMRERNLEQVTMLHDDDGVFTVHQHAQSGRVPEPRITESVLGPQPGLEAQEGQSRQTGQPGRNFESAAKSCPDGTKTLPVPL